MTQPWTWKRILWPIGVLAVSASLSGVECQYEPVPDRRRGFSGDPCMAEDRCQSGLVCVQEANNKVCRPICTQGDPNACGGCGATSVCKLFPQDGGAGISACTPGAKEGEQCVAKPCAQCLTCGAEEAGDPPTCRRSCRGDIPPPPVGTAPPGDYSYCTYPDRAEIGGVRLANCCLFGQTCSSVTVDGGSQADLCFGPLPGEEFSTCRPNNTCNDSRMPCVAGTPEANIPNVCRLPIAGEVCASGARCATNHACIDEDKNSATPARCRLICSLEVEQCADCGEAQDCVPIENDAQRRGVCLPAVTEGGACGGGALCAQCLVCASKNNGPATCVRACNPPDAGPVSGACLQPVADGGTVDPGTCCPTGQECLAFTGGAGAACFPP
ncbi:MAG: hypothetical protein AB2A00_31670 [Myxococcota bacterium]